MLLHSLPKKKSDVLWSSSRIPSAPVSSTDSDHAAQPAPQPPKKNKLKKVAKWTSIALLTPIIAAANSASLLALRLIYSSTEHDSQPMVKFYVRS